MNKEYYEQLRSDLTADIARLLAIHCKLCAKARIRKIAQLDYEHRGMDIEETKNNYNYHKL